jgi:hypothetical protein
MFNAGGDLSSQGEVEVAGVAAGGKKAVEARLEWLRRGIEQQPRREAVSQISGDP